MRNSCFSFFKARQIALAGAILTLNFVLASCADEDRGANGGNQDSLSAIGNKIGTGGCTLLTGRNTVVVDSVEVEVWVPEEEVKADLLLLPGWNFSRTSWCENSFLCRKALHEGYRLIMPEMGKSVYATRYYEQTRVDWRKYPTSTWVADTLIPELQKKYCLLRPGADNFVLGLSTGGRGVAILGLKLPDLFKCGAALSGDFDQTLIPGDNLMESFYGRYSEFPERWKGEDNPTVRAKEFKMAIYLAHGKKDDWVPWTQSEAFYKALKRENPTLRVTLNFQEESGHNYVFWDSEVDNMLAFFKGSAHTPAEANP